MAVNYVVLLSAAALFSGEFVAWLERSGLMLQALPAALAALGLSLMLGSIDPGAPGRSAVATVGSWMFGQLRTALALLAAVVLVHLTWAGVVPA